MQSIAPGASKDARPRCFRVAASRAVALRGPPRGGHLRVTVMDWARPPKKIGGPQAADCIPEFSH
jgi:hypothetical protein